MGKVLKLVLMNFLSYILIFLIYLLDFITFLIFEIIPVQKKPNIEVINDLRPVALTPILMKCFERVVLSFFEVNMHNLLDPFQFA